MNTLNKPMSTENKCCDKCERECKMLGCQGRNGHTQCVNPHCECHTPHQKDTSDPVERYVEALRVKMRVGCDCKSCRDNNENIGKDCVIRTTLKAIQDGERERLNEAIPFVLDTLNEINLKGKLEYADYSRLHDEISALNTNSQ